MSAKSRGMVDAVVQRVLVVRNHAVEAITLVLPAVFPVDVSEVGSLCGVIDVASGAMAAGGLTDGGGVGWQRHV